MLIEWEHDNSEGRSHHPMVALPVDLNYVNWNVNKLLILIIGKNFELLRLLHEKKLKLP